MPGAWLGELIFHNLVRYGKWTKPARRLWMQSMTDEAILNAWHSMRSETDMQPLTNAAVCRSESDRLVGLNSTRALTILQSRGGFTAGRVQIPTLAILTVRNWKSRRLNRCPIRKCGAESGVQSGSYSGRWIDRDWKRTTTRSPARNASGTRNRRPSSATAAAANPAR